MNTNSRIKNSTLNFISNVVIQGIAFVTAFVVRRVFIQSLGVEFLGINGLFNNILTILSLAELGIGTAMSYSMYKAVKDADKDRLTGLNNYYRSLYNRIAIIVLVLGLSLLPFLQYIVKLDRMIPHLHIYYALEVVNSVISYLFVYKTTIVNADQSGYKLNYIGFGLQLITSVLQIMALLAFKKYMIYLLIGIGITFVNNLVRSHFAEKWYPFIKDKTKVLPDVEKKEIWKNIKSMFMYKISGVILNNTDNILISVIVNTAMVGIYSNYLMIYNKANVLINMVFSAIIPSVGNYNAKATPEEKYKLFNTVDFISYISYSLIAICVYFCGDDLIRAVTGTNTLLLTKNVLIVTIIYFYLNMLKRAIAVFRETTGLFKYGKYSILISAILNLIFSVILGKLYGIFGILLATIIARLLSDIWYEPFVLYRVIFHKKVGEYYGKQIFRLLVVIGIIILIIPINSVIAIDHLYFRLAIKGMITMTITLCIFILVFRKNQSYIYIKGKFRDIIMKSILKVNANKSFNNAK